ncbi:MAG: hypothetical protein QM726_14445 [Chitinophagaceae bacterium]
MILFQIIIIALISVLAISAIAFLVELLLIKSIGPLLKGLNKYLLAYNGSVSEVNAVIKTINSPIPIWKWLVTGLIGFGTIVGICVFAVKASKPEPVSPIPSSDNDKQVILKPDLKNDTFSNQTPFQIQSYSTSSHLCVISKTITHQNPKNTRSFYYNKMGDPDSVINQIASTGWPDLYFKYDNKNRLVEYYSQYKNGLVENTHRYVYKGDIIIRDTVISEHTGSPFISCSYLIYDKQGRIIIDSQVMVKSAIQPIRLSTKKYFYDVGGNLLNEFGSAFKYDNRLNPRLTNKIWMFIDRNYSINNPIRAQSYTKYNYPSVLTNFNSSYSLFTGQPYSDTLVSVVYLCK